MKLKYILITILIITFSACSVFENEEGVMLSTSSDRLIIENNFDVKIYYNVMDRDCALYTDWAAFKTDNPIKSDGSKKLNFNNIYTDKERDLLKGDEVEVAWWTDEFLERTSTFGIENDGKNSGFEYITL